MRRWLILCALCLIVVVVGVPTLLTELTVKPVASPHVDGTDTLSVQVYFPEEQQVRELPLGEYLKGVVAAEMPAEFLTEALTAQFIVARTYTVKRMQRFNGPGKGGCPLSPRADVCADPATGQAFISRDEAIKKYGKLAATNLWQRLEQIQAETEGVVLKYQGQLIDPLYHSVSGTTTEDAADYYGESLPYLKPVDDHWGADAPKLVDTKRFQPGQLASALSGDGKVIPAASVTSMASAGTAPVQILSSTAGNRVKSVKVGGTVLTGREFRERLGLQSTNFTVTVQNGQVVIRTVGYGHGVGMSQYGANGMARAGKAAPEILTHYYTGVTVARLFEG
jgi:stage II sporulation protein D